MRRGRVSLLTFGPRVCLSSRVPARVRVSAAPAHRRTRDMTAYTHAQMSHVASAARPEATPTNTPKRGTQNSKTHTPTPRYIGAHGSTDAQGTDSRPIPYSCVERDDLDLSLGSAWSGVDTRTEPFQVPHGTRHYRRV